MADSDSTIDVRFKSQSELDRSELALRRILVPSGTSLSDTAHALENITDLAALHAVDALAPFVEGFCWYLAVGRNTNQRALDDLRDAANPTYVRLRNLLRTVSGATRLKTVQPIGEQRAVAPDSLIAGVHVSDIEAALNTYFALNGATELDGRTEKIEAPLEGSEMSEGKMQECVVAVPAVRELSYSHGPDASGGRADNLPLVREPVGGRELLCFGQSVRCC